MNLSAELLKLIDHVAQAESQEAAAQTLLIQFMKMFDMDQAALCEVAADVQINFAMDRTRKILNSSDELWLSHTLIDTALRTQEPQVHRDELLRDAGGIPRSITEHRIKNCVCVPLGAKPAKVIYLVSKRNPLREYASDELASLKTAAQAAVLALNQHQNLSVLKNKNRELESFVQGQRQLIYASPRMQQLHEEVRRLATFNISILLQGPSGSGKEEIAREIHRLSGRAGRFVAINCANLSETLLESELFGYVKGAFTGATGSKPGLLQEADGGTFFFDEVAEIPLNLQAKILRALQERVIRPVGATVDKPIDIRIIAASHCDLRNAIRAGKFREDLYYRLQEMTIDVPRLAERRQDIELLASHFITQFSQEYKFPLRHLTAEAREALENYAWPGNVRELKNVCRTAVIISRGPNIEVADLRLPTLQPQAAAESELARGVESTDSSLKERTRQFERQVVLGMLRESGGQTAQVAERLGVSVRTLQRILSDKPDSAAAAEV